MISWEALVYLLVAAIASSVGVILFRRLEKWLRQRNKYEQQLRDLASPPVRRELTAAFAKWGVIGDADIRDGKIFATVTDDLVDPLAVVFMNAAAQAARLQNPAACSIYVRDSVNDRFILLSELDLDHIVDAARVMQRVAEEKLIRRHHNG